MVHGQRSILIIYEYFFRLTFNRERLHRFTESASKKPLISLVGGIVKDYQPLWESVYFYSMFFYPIRSTWTMSVF